MLFENQRALRVDPNDFNTTSTTLTQNLTDAAASITALETLFTTYRTAQKGPDIDVIETIVTDLAAGFKSVTSGYEYLADAFTTAYRTTSRLETESDNLWDDVLQVSEEFTPDQQTDFQQRFDNIRDEEETAMSTLASAIEQTPTGADMAINEAAVNELINRLIDDVQNPNIDVDLTVSRELLADYVEDGDFDISERVEEALTDGDYSPDEIALLMHEDTDTEIREKILAGVDFPDGDRFSGNEIEKLLFGELDFDVTVAILEDPELDFPDGEILDAVYDAMVEGNVPEGMEGADKNFPHFQMTDIDPRYFPAWYIEYLQNEAEIVEAERRRDDVDGVPIIPDWLDPSDREEPRVEIDAELEELRKTKAEYEEQYGIGSFRHVNEVTAASVTGERLGDDHWKGVTLGDIAIEHGHTSRIASELTEHPETSVGFFNTLGPLETQNFAADSTDDSIEDLSVALGEATRHDGEHQLDFTGTELFTPVSGRSTPNLVEELLVTGDFEEGFWVDSAVAVVEARKRNRPRLGNIVLSEASKDPELVVKVVEGLEENDPSLAALLDPNAAFEGQEIAEFLTVAGDDADTSATILIAGAEVEDFKDPGTAAGVDAIMAKHVTVIYDEEYLEGHGVLPDETGRLSQEELSRLGFGPDEWNALADNVHDHGFGGFVAAGNEQLLSEAMRSELEAEGSDGVITPENYERFAYVSGALNEQAFQARLDIAQQLDDDNDAKNTYLQAGAAVAAAFATAGIPAVSPVAIPGSVVFGVDVAAGTGIDLLFPEFWETDHAITVTENDRQAAKTSSSQASTQGRIAWLQATGEQIEVPIRDKAGPIDEDSDIVTVSVVSEKVRDPSTGVITETPVLHVVSSDGEPWTPAEGESLDWGALGVEHPIEQNASASNDIIGSEQGFNQALAEKTGTSAPTSTAANSFEGISGEDRKAADPWLGL